MPSFLLFLMIKWVSRPKTILPQRYVDFEDNVNKLKKFIDAKQRGNKF
jgi:hypothetical protein